MSVTIEVEVMFGVPLIIDPPNDDQAGRPATPSAAYYSNFTPPLAVGSIVYAQVDSVNLLTTYGAVLETHEISGGPYNNILGPVLSTLSAASESQPLIVRSDSATTDQLPARTNP